MSRPERAEGFIAGVAALLLAVFAVAAFHPRGPVWGFHGLAYFPVGIRWGSLGLAVLLLVAGIWWTPFHRVEVRLSDLLRARSWVPWALGALAFLAFTSFPIQHSFYGDARHMEAWYGENERFAWSWWTQALETDLFRSKEALTVAVHRTVAWAFSTSVTQAYRVVSALSGALHLVLWLTLLRRVPALGAAVAGLAVAGLFAGGNQVFFGHVENYAFAAFCGSLYLAAGWAVLAGRLRYVWLMAAWLLAARSHAVYLTLFPSLLWAGAFVLAGTRPVVKPLLRYKGALVALVLPALALGGYLYFFHFGSYRVPYMNPGGQVESAFLPLVVPDPPLRNYTLFSWSHLLDLDNILAFVGLPALGIVLGRGLAGHGAVLWNHPRMIFLSLAFLFPFLFFFALNPVLSMPRDWDLYTLLLPPILFLAAGVTARDGESGDGVAGHGWGILGPVCALAIFIVPMFAVNADTGRLSRRLEDVGEHTYRTYYAGSSYLIHGAQKLDENLPEQLRRREGTLVRLEPWLGVDDYEYGFLLATAGALHSRLGDNRTAATRFEEALRTTIRLSSLHLELASLYLNEGEFRLALRHAEHYLRLDPRSLPAAKRGLTAAVGLGDADATARILPRAVELGQGDPEVIGLREEAERRGLWTHP